MSWYTYFASLMLTTLVSLASGLGALFGDAAPAPETIRRTLPWSPGANAVFELSNTRGDIHIVAEDRSDISVVATRTVERQGNSNDPGPAVDFRRDGDRTRVCGDDSHCGCNVEWPRGGRRWRDAEHTTVRVDFEVRVPKRATLDVCAVNGDLVKVEGVEGSYNLHHVNGDLEMAHVRGAGRASTVNGDVVATFDAAPQSASEFKTVNGRVDVTLPASLSADLRLKTMNGGLYTDFETTALPVKPIAEQRGGRFVYRSDRYASVRVGKGGPELTFETLNGNVQVRKR